MIRRLVYVACDNCGSAIGGADDMAEDAVGARINARRIGAARVRRGVKVVDLCRNCKDIK